MDRRRTLRAVLLCVLVATAAATAGVGAGAGERVTTGGSVDDGGRAGVGPAPSTTDRAPAIGAGGVTATVREELATAVRDGTLRGTVTDGTGAGVGNATVEVSATNETTTYTATTASDGRFSLAVPGYDDDATYEVTVRADGYLDGYLPDVVVGPGETTDVAVTLAASEPRATVDAIDAASRATAGESLAVRATVTNAGSVEGSVDVTAALVNGSDALVASTTRGVALAAGETATVDASLDTTGLPAGNYTLVVATGNDSANRSPSVASADGVLRGTVRDGTNDPVANATVVVTAPGYELRVPNATDATGDYAVRVPGLGSDSPYAVGVAKPGYRSVDAGTVTVGPGGTATVDATLLSVTRVGDVEVSPGSANATVGEAVSFVATVYNASSAPRRTLSGRRVSASSSDGDVTFVGSTTKTTGDAGTATFTVTTGTLASARLDFVVTGGTQPTTSASVTFESPPGPDDGTVAVTVVDGASDPVANADLLVSARGTDYAVTVPNATGTDGRAAVDVPGYGDAHPYAVTVRKTGATRWESSGVIVDPGRTTRLEATIQPVGDGRLRGTVEDGAGSPVPNATVRATASGYDRTYVAETNASGAYALSVPGYADAAPYAVTVSKPGFERDATNASVDAGATTTADATLVAPPEEILSGRVTDASAANVAGASVVVASSGSTETYETTTDDTGKYLLQVPGFGRDQPYRLSIRAPGYRTVEKRVIVTAADNATVVDATLRRPADGTVLTTATNTSGDPVANVSVRVRPARFDGGTATATGPRGVASAAVPGYGGDVPYRVTLSTDGYVTSRTEVVVRSNATTSVDATLLATGENPFPSGVPGVSDRPPTNADADPAYEDVDGDGRTGFLDVVALLFADWGAINGDPARTQRLDHTRDGRVGFLDVVDLLFQL